MTSWRGVHGPSGGSGRGGWAAAAGGALALAAALLAWDVFSPPPPRPVAGADPSRAGAHAMHDQTRRTAERPDPSRGQPRGDAPGDPRRPGDATAAAPRVPARFAREARAAVDRQIAAAGLDAALDEAARAELVDALAAVRVASRRTQRAGGADAVTQAARVRTVLAADRLFRERLGIGVAAFLGAQGPPGRIVDLAASRP